MIRNIILLLLSNCTLFFNFNMGMAKEGIDPINKNIAKTTHDPIYGIVFPTGMTKLNPIKQSERLKSLNGINIALVGGSFNAHITHIELKRLFLERFPNSKVYLLNEIGNAGQYTPQSRQVKEFQSKLKELGIQAVISGNAGCGICTLKEVGNSISAEYIGIPAVTIAATSFSNLVISTSISKGLSAPRVAIYPGAFTSHTKEELIENTQKIVFPQVIDALMKGITEDELKKYDKETVYNPKDIIFSGTYTEVNNYFVDNNWSDGFPIVPPTLDRIEDFLKYTDYAWDQVINTVPPSNREILTWHVAVNGVMAGCKPEYMPILIAYTKAMSNGNYRRPLSSTHGWTPYGWINGPLARQLGLDSGQGMISNPNNVTIGRFINLALLNFSGYSIKENRMGTFGYLMPWFFSEDELACERIGWMPYHVQKGFSIHDNVFTAASALLWGNNLTPATPDPDKIIELISWDITEKQQNALGATNPTVHRTLLVTESVARDLSKSYSKGGLEDMLIKTARRPSYMRAYANYWANPGSQQYEKYTFNQYQANINRKENAQLTDLPKWFEFENVNSQKKVLTVSVMEKGMTSIIVAGDSDRNKVQTIPGGAFYSVKIDLPKNWDVLMENLGYKSLKEFMF
ncbi:hypothetical protein G5B35_17860 [Parapusillimonas sp. SGNA-6]|uniref:UGSC family (seleno)protein n=1 Tax=Parapedobacter sp. SGR-10 TaxID=2710879 RepID=UPI0013D086F0|nr:hypothetical protein [Parapedobacter sp. SGR-10]NGF57279.1 hypothetical protein [Parapedobacter sp. SGR-10]NGM89164.1 hypothetical protein [Parapusillimonas sp. SGNA-6]